MTKEILVLTTAPGASVLNAAILNQIAETVPSLPTADILARDEAAEELGGGAGDGDPAQPEWAPSAVRLEVAATAAVSLWMD